MKALTLYSRPGCHLCDELAEAVAPLLPGRASLEIVDVDGDLALKKRYGLRIPVLVGGGRELCDHRLDLTKVEAYLSSADG